MKKIKILATGSGGFIIGNFIRQAFFNKKPYTISSIDRVRETHLVQNIYINSDHAFYIADVLDTHILRTIVEKEKPDIIIHGADNCNINDSGKLLLDNITGTQNVINECLNIGARLILLSSDKVYGSLDLGSSVLWSESEITAPNNIYSVSKLAEELLVKSSGINNGLKYNIVRLGNNYGPWQTKEKFIPKVIRSILDDEMITIFGQGNQVRDWTHVYDSCMALFSVIDNGINGEIYNITAKQEFSNIEITQKICNTIGKGFELIKNIEDKQNHDPRRAMNNDKIKSLSWNYKYKFKDGIVQTCQWYLTNKYVLKM
jgi:dTDP-glucose 4,6-dehydratase